MAPYPSEIRLFHHLQGMQDNHHADALSRVLNVYPTVDFYDDDDLPTFIATLEDEKPNG